ncbi:acyl-CoA carboxylase epsilon subunit-like protein [Stackebrandtia endophytica]|uniref:Acyl-CoA carboxylase epsilon subunit-like protein n=1 Tax=Stackebrandtia endophytica TaxID=1496996 RepID=A0A543ATB8_9ACTN|nr:acyl-CoA carboxylase epsilon subunit [Stackebrandtia endophytica]TQL75829.1 acyl-CoA carboxylase epsilon subunit-like protein [Stackebrandtia endophytica]
MDIKVIAGSPDAADLAVVCAVLTSGSTVAAPRAPRRAASAWGSPARRLGVARDWRDSSLPAL